MYTELDESKKICTIQMTSPPKWLAMIVVVFYGSLASTATLLAQSATITVAPIPTTVAGNSISVNWTVTNTGTTTRSFGVGAEIRQGSVVFADLGCQFTPNISPGGTAFGSFTYTIPANWSGGTYTARAAVWTGTCGSSTWLNSYDRDFVVQAQITSATITIANIGTVVAGSPITVSYTVTNTGNYSRTFGVGAEIWQGSTVLADLGCQFTPTIAPNSTVSGSFSYTIPANWSGGTYTARGVVWTGTCGTTTWLNSYDRNFTVQAQSTSATIAVASIGTVVAGNPITVSYTVTNTGNYSRSFGVGAEIRRGTTVLASLGCQFTLTIAPGATASGSFNYTIPANWIGGTYTARAVVWTGTCGTTTNLNYYDRNFTVQQAPLTISGRLAYHTNSNYLAVPVDTIDGHIYICSLPNGPLRKLTRSLPVVNPMNPHVSNDGSKIVFMAVPSDKANEIAYDSVHNYWHRLRTNLDIYVYDLATENLLRLTNNSPVPDEDPKFSPDNQKMVFKRSGQIWTMNSDGTDTAQLTSSTGEKSGPCYSTTAGDGRIVYWKTTQIGSTRYGDIAWRLPNGTEQPLVNGTPTRYCYYPIWRDADHILFTISEGVDNLYQYTISTATYAPLSELNSAANESDSFPVDSSLIGFSRTVGQTSYDIYVGYPSTGAAYPISAANSVHQDLGGWHCPYIYARKLVVRTPANGAQLTRGTASVLTVRAYSNGGIWTSANPSVTFVGPVSQTYTGLLDDGTQGDSIAGDGIYSRTVTLPNVCGAYAVSANAQSIDPGGTHALYSIPTSVTLQDPSFVHEIEGALQISYHLYQNHPNPFNPVTTIEFSIPKETLLEIVVFNTLGMQVAVLVKQRLPAGSYRTQWIPSQSATGVYFYQLRSPDFNDTKKLLLLR